MLATQLDGLTLVNLGDKMAMRDDHFYGSNPKWATNLRIFGEAWVAKEGNDSKMARLAIDEKQ